MSLNTLKTEFLTQLVNFRLQGQNISEINPISALADDIHGRLYRGELARDDLVSLTDDLAIKLQDVQVNCLRSKTGLANMDAVTEQLMALTDLDMSQPLYSAVFTAHPVFALQRDKSLALCAIAAETDDIGALATEEPIADLFSPRTAVSLAEEHEEAMMALERGRQAIRDVYRLLLSARVGQLGWLDVVPEILSVSTWVGYDLDGRSDITWSMSFSFRLKEKARALGIYLAEIEKINPTGSLLDLRDRLAAEQASTFADIARFEALNDGPQSFVAASNALTERKDKLTSSAEIAKDLHKMAQAAEDDPKKAIALMCLAGDVKSHGFGMGDVHFRINAVQLRNAMRSVDGRIVSVTGDAISSRVLVERVAARIREEEPASINFQSIEEEQATARRQLMIAAQFLKHVDSDRPIRLLIAECEQPLTAMTALYLAHLFGIKDKIDISPLFETTFGLESGSAMIRQLLTYDVFCDYVRSRGRLAIETGFSDAGRFMGQIAASLAIERLQLKLARLLHKRFEGEVDLLLFNTHGESLGRGGAGETMQERQDHILSPYVRAECCKLGIRLIHESSFQGGDGYRLFGNAALATASIRSLLLAEVRKVTPEERLDPFYDRPDFSLDMFLALKAWHDRLFASPDYGEFLDLFGANLLVKSGSRPSKRVVQAGLGRKDPSKMRAIPHNATLQQMGFLANVVSGIGYAAHVDRDAFVELYANSPRLKALMSHVFQAKSLGSLNTTQAYGRILDSGFWIDRAYHGHEVRNLKAYRKLAALLQDGVESSAVRKTVWLLRNDLMDLYRLSRVLGIEGVRTQGHDRLELDLLHAIRIAVILNSLSLICQTPRFAESNHYSNDDVIRLALKLDFESVHNIIVSEFSLDKGRANDMLELAEPASHNKPSLKSYLGLQDKVLKPLKMNRHLILKISQMISAHYGAHG